MSEVMVTLNSRMLLDISINLYRSRFELKKMCCNKIKFCDAFLEAIDTVRGLKVIHLINS